MKAAIALKDTTRDGAKAHNLSEPVDLKLATSKHPSPLLRQQPESDVPKPSPSHESPGWPNDGNDDGLDEAFSELMELYKNGDWCPNNVAGTQLSNGAYVAIMRSIMLPKGNMPPVAETLLARLARAQEVSNILEFPPTMHDEILALAMDDNSWVMTEHGEWGEDIRSECYGGMSMDDFSDPQAYFEWRQAVLADVDEVLQVQEVLPAMDGVLQIKILSGTVTDTPVDPLRKRIYDNGGPVHPYVAMYFHDGTQCTQRCITHVARGTRAPQWDLTVPPICITSDRAVVQFKVRHCDHSCPTFSDTVLGQCSLDLKTLQPGLKSQTLTLDTHAPPQKGKPFWSCWCGSAIMDGPQDQEMDTRAMDIEEMYDVQDSLLGTMGRRHPGKLTVEVTYVKEKRMAADQPMPSRLATGPQQAFRPIEERQSRDKLRAQTMSSSHGASTLASSTMGSRDRASTVGSREHATKMSSSSQDRASTHLSAMPSNTTTSKQSSSTRSPPRANLSGWAGLGGLGSHNISPSLPGKKMRRFSSWRRASAVFSTGMVWDAALVVDRCTPKTALQTYRELAATLWRAKENGQAFKIPLSPESEDFDMEIPQDGPLGDMLQDESVQEMLTFGTGGTALLLSFARLYLIRQETQMITLTQYILESWMPSEVFIRAAYTGLMSCLELYYDAKLTKDEVKGFKGMMGFFLERAIPTLRDHYAQLPAPRGRPSATFLLLEMVGWAYTWDPKAPIPIDSLTPHLDAAAEKRLKDLPTLHTSVNIQDLLQLSTSVESARNDLQRDMMTKVHIANLETKVIEWTQNRFTSICACLDQMFTLEPGKDNNCRKIVWELEEEIQSYNAALVRFGICRALPAPGEGNVPLTLSISEVATDSDDDTGALNLYCYDAEPAIIEVMSRWIEASAIDMAAHFRRLVGAEKWKVTSDEVSLCLAQMRHPLNAAIDAWVEKGHAGSDARRITLRDLIIKWVHYVFTQFASDLVDAFFVEMRCLNQASNAPTPETAKGVRGKSTLDKSIRWGSFTANEPPLTKTPPSATKSILKGTPSFKWSTLSGEASLKSDISEIVTPTASVSTRATDPSFVSDCVLDVFGARNHKAKEYQAGDEQEIMKRLESVESICLNEAACAICNTLDQVIQDTLDMETVLNKALLKHGERNGSGISMQMVSLRMNSMQQQQAMDGLMGRRRSVEPQLECIDSGEPEQGGRGGSSPYQYDSGQVTSRKEAAPRLKFDHADMMTTWANSSKDSDEETDDEGEELVESRDSYPAVPYTTYTNTMYQRDIADDNSSSYTDIFPPASNQADLIPNLGAAPNVEEPLDSKMIVVSVFTARWKELEASVNGFRKEMLTEYYHQYRVTLSKMITSAYGRQPPSAKILSGILTCISGELACMGKYSGAAEETEVLRGFVGHSWKGAIAALNAISLNLANFRPLEEQEIETVEDFVVSLQEIYKSELQTLTAWDMDAPEEQQRIDAVTTSRALLQALQASTVDLTEMFEAQLRCRQLMPISDGHVWELSPQQLSLLNILRMLRQRCKTDSLARDFVSDQLKLAGALAAQFIFGLSASERVSTEARCSFGSSSRSVGRLYITQHCVSFTTVLESDLNKATDRTLCLEIDRIKLRSEENEFYIDKISFCYEGEDFEFSSFQTSMDSSRVLAVLQEAEAQRLNQQQQPQQQQQEQDQSEALGSSQTLPTKASQSQSAILPSGSARSSPCSPASSARTLPTPSVNLADKAMQLNGPAGSSLVYMTPTKLSRLGLSGAKSELLSRQSSPWRRDAAGSSLLSGAKNEPGCPQSLPTSNDTLGSSLVYGAKSELASRLSSPWRRDAAGSSLRSVFGRSSSQMESSSMVWPTTSATVTATASSSTCVSTRASKSSTPLKVASDPASGSRNSSQPQVCVSGGGGGVGLPSGSSILLGRVSASIQARPSNQAVVGHLLTPHSLSQQGSDYRLKSVRLSMRLSGQQRSASGLLKSRESQQIVGGGESLQTQLSHQGSEVRVSRTSDRSSGGDRQLPNRTSPGVSGRVGRTSDRSSGGERQLPTRTSPGVSGRMSRTSDRSRGGDRQLTTRASLGVSGRMSRTSDRSSGGDGQLFTRSSLPVLGSQTSTACPPVHRISGGAGAVRSLARIVSGHPELSSSAMARIDSDASPTRSSRPGVESADLPPSSCKQVIADLLPSSLKQVSVLSVPCYLMGTLKRFNGSLELFSDRLDFFLDSKVLHKSISLEDVSNITQRQFIINGVVLRVKVLGESSPYLFGGMSNAVLTALKQSISDVCFNPS